mmetsp:Transcript_24572/g.24812  ORF Transcript_24572/g.24812 Transcript_24572/m.24812 type:complete len:102 (+) Transcript_24572:215-520(+)
MADKQLKARIEKEMKLSNYVRSVREYESSVSKAQWEESLTIKDRINSRSRFASSLKDESQFYNEMLRKERREKIAALYRQDEMKYQQELESMGLAYRKDRL